MKTITFYSYKGGTGQTLALVNVAKYLARFGKSVVIMDFDLEAPGLHYKFGLHQNRKPEQPLRGVVDLLNIFDTQGKFPDSLEDYLYDVGPKHGTGRIRLLPAGDTPSVNYWEQLAAINWYKLFYEEPDPPGNPLFEELRLWIEQTIKPDFLLIDSRTGFTEIGGVATTIMPDIVVCLLINNPENMDGARAVLRSICTASRPKGRKPVEILPVVTRIPHELEDHKKAKILEDIRIELNQEAPDLTDTLALEEMCILHSEPSLQVQETLTIDTDMSPLLRDYLRLFSRLISPETIQPHVAGLIKEARDILLDNPDEAQQKLESLVEFSNHPMSYRALIGLYHLRRAESGVILETAFRYYNVYPDPTDPILQSTIRTHFKPYGKWDKPKYTIEFILDIWNANTQKEIDFAKKIVETLFNHNRNEECITLSTEMLNQLGFDEDVFLFMLQSLKTSEQFDAALRLIEKHKKTVVRLRERLQEVWAEIVIATKDSDRAHKLSKNEFELFLNSKPLLAYQVFMLRDLTKEQKMALLDNVTSKVLPLGLSHDLERVGGFFWKEGRFDTFEKEVKEKNFPAGEVEKFLRRVRKNLV